MTVTIGVPAAAPSDALALRDAVDVAARRLLDDLGVDVDVAVEFVVPEPDVALVIGAKQVPTIAGLADMLLSPADVLVATLAIRRDMLIEQSVAELGLSPADAMSFTLLGALGVSARLLPDSSPATTAETAIALAMEPTDQRPLGVRVAPGDVESSFVDVHVYDEALRASLFERLAVPLPPCVETDPTQPKGTVSVRVRDVHYPTLPTADDHYGRLLAYLAQLLTPGPLVTPAAAEAILVIGTQSLPHSARLARARWTPAELTNLLRVGLERIRPAPSDLAALVEAIACADRPDDSVDDALAADFPGLAAGYMLF